MQQRRILRTIFGMILVVILIAIGAIWLLLQDKTGPEIQFLNDTITYREGDNLSILLEDCVAMDKHDGDVTDQIQIAGIDVISDGTKMEVTYIAYDKKNNATVVSRIINYEGSRIDIGTEDVQGPSMEDESSSEAEIIEADDVAYNDKKKIEQEQAIAALEELSPILRLLQHRIRIQVGTSVDPYDYVEEAKSRSGQAIYLSEIGTYDSSVPGTYTIKLCVTDEEGRVSNEEVLQIVVE